MHIHAHMHTDVHEQSKFKKYTNMKESADMLRICFKKVQICYKKRIIDYYIHIHIYHHIHIYVYMVSSP